MSEKTNISWCDSTINFWSGCTKVSPGCANCYAEALSNRGMGNVGKWGKGAPRQLHVSAFKLALRMNKKPWICNETGDAGTEEQAMSSPKGKNWHRRRIFSLSLGDWLDDEVPIEWLEWMLDTIRQCPDVTWILCTKRPENWRLKIEKIISAMAGRQMPENLGLAKWLFDWLAEKSPPHIILLTSVENQDQADKRIPELLKMPAVCHGISAEPLLGPVQLKTSGNPLIWPQAIGRNGLRWIIAGGESGPSARPCNVEWIRSLVEQGKAAGVATFVKQLGARPVIDEMTPDGWPVGTNLIPRTGETALADLNDKKGGDPSEWPADLRVQEWPTLSKKWVENLPL